MRTYLAPLGFDSRRVVRPVLSEGLDQDDEVVILRPSDSSDRGEDALEEVEEVLTQVAPDLTLQTESLPYSDFVETVLYCTDLIRAADGETVVILGGGARELLFPLVVATFSSDKWVDTILQVGDIDSSVRRLPKLNLRGYVTDAEAELLLELTNLNTPLTISQIADKADKSKSTIARHVTSLEEEGFVETQQDGRAKTVTVTDGGRVFLKSRN
ncbi:CRISPR-associated CARF protein Csa3 [Halomicrobium salinisoli]|uniref:CRISPR-associated CARF protein Csa3 n=1 Tax=Halomicrobium salinisoli TaxID=2878391 RepID=UPI001CF0316A|nr:CRISPR-associated CARF protein Csa3 [Halomicrobium salinisoli]